MKVGDRVRRHQAYAGDSPLRGTVLYVNTKAPGAVAAPGGALVDVRWDGALPDDATTAHLFHDGDVVSHPIDELEPADAPFGEIFIPIEDLLEVQPLAELAGALLFAGGDA